MPVTDIPTFTSRLQAAGVAHDTLSPAQAKSLAADGYLVVPALIDATWLAQLRQAFEDLWILNREEGMRKKGTRHVLGWQDYCPELLVPLFEHPLLLAAAWQVIARPFGLGGIHGREPLSGHGAQGLHADWGYDGDPKQFHLLNSLWLLDDFTPDNGPTRVVPGTQVQRKLPQKAIGPEDRHPGQILVTAPAGSALIFNGHLWHSGTRNLSGAPRRALQCSLVAAEFRHLLAIAQPDWSRGLVEPGFPGQPGLTRMA